MKLSHQAAMVGLFLAMTGLNAASLRISQLADRSPDLMVFLAADASAEPRSVTKEGAKAALGKLTLGVKDAKPWNQKDGASVVVAVDVSSSMKAVDFPAIQRALAEVLAGLPPSSKSALLTIGTDAKTEVEFGPVDAVRQAVGGLAPEATRTALNEGILAAQALAARGINGLPLRRFVLLVTDGFDDSKRAVGSNEVISGVAHGDIPIFVIAVTGKQRSAGLEPLGQMARASGGGFIQTTPSRVAEDLKALVAEALRVDLLTVDCTACPRDGEVRMVQISVIRNGGEVTVARGTWLFAASPPLQPPPFADVKPRPPAPPDHDWLAKVQLKLKVVWPWPLWQLAVLLLLLLASAVAGGMVLWRKAQHKRQTVTVIKDNPPDIHVVIGIPPQVSSEPPGTSSPQVSLTVDVLDVGRMHLVVGAADVVLGRSASANVSAEKDGEASGRHAALYVEKGVLMVRDLGSANGTALNGTRIVRPEPVRDRDVVRIGRTDVRIYFGRL